MQNLGDFFDFAINTCHYDPEDVVDLWIDSGIADEFGYGMPVYLVGRTGCEMFRDCLWKLDIPQPKEKDILYFDKSPEYWAGFVLAHYQWKKNKPFKEILDKVSISQIIKSYHPLHEADYSKFEECMDDWILKAEKKEALCK